MVPPFTILSSLDLSIKWTVFEIWINHKTRMFSWGVWKSRNSESGIRNRSRKRNRDRDRNLNWDRGKPGSTETSSRYPCGNKIQDGVLCYHFFEKFSAQWSWYQRYNHIRKVTSNQKEHNHSNSKNQPMLFRRRLEHKFKHNNFTFSHVLTFQSIRRFVAICKRKQIRFCKMVTFF